MTQRIADDQFTATVTDIREHSRANGRIVWQMALDRSAFLPGTSGTLTATAKSGASITITVTDVEEDAAGDLWHATEKPLLPGADVVARVERN